MTTKVTMICAIASVWCAATAVKVAITVLRRETYVASWWEAGVAGTGRKLGPIRAVIKLITMLAISVVCALTLAELLIPNVALYIVIGVIGVAAVSELSAPKPKRER